MSNTIMISVQYYGQAIRPLVPSGDYCNHEIKYHIPPNKRTWGLLVRKKLRLRGGGGCAYLGSMRLTGRVW